MIVVLLKGITNHEGSNFRKIKNEEWNKTLCALFTKCKGIKSSHRKLWLSSLYWFSRVQKVYGTLKGLKQLDNNEDMLYLRYLRTIYLSTYPSRIESGRDLEERRKETVWVFVLFWGQLGCFSRKLFSIRGTSVQLKEYNKPWSLGGLWSEIVNVLFLLIIDKVRINELVGEL